MPLPTKGMKNALGRRAQGSGKGFGITPTNNPKSGLPNKPPEHSSGGKGAPSVIGNGLAPAPSQMEGRAAVGKIHGNNPGARTSPPENGSGNRNNIPNSLTLGQGQHDNGRPAPAAMARRIGKGSSPENAGGSPFKLGGGMTLGQHQDQNGRAKPGMGNPFGKVSGSGFGGTARNPGTSDTRAPGSMSATTKIGGFNGKGKTRFSPMNTKGAGTMLKKKVGGNKSMFKDGGGDDSN